jgi:hypothetical protein
MPEPKNKSATTGKRAAKEDPRPTAIRIAQRCRKHSTNTSKVLHGTATVRNNQSANPAARPKKGTALFQSRHATKHSSAAETSNEAHNLMEFKFTKL